jgi:hypothetical protein
LGSYIKQCEIGEQNDSKKCRLVKKTHLVGRLHAAERGSSVSNEVRLFRLSMKLNGSSVLTPSLDAMSPARGQTRSLMRE